jgi:hypothetical protein
MPLLFYLPMIIWLGMVEAARDERVPVKIKVQKYTRLEALTHEQTKRRERSAHRLPLAMSSGRVQDCKHHSELSR